MKLNIDMDSVIKKISVLTKKGFFGDLVGEYRSAFRGRGLEFTAFRNYDNTDDAVRIDWKATLRSKDILVRQFEEERNLNVMFLFDTSNSMLYSSTRQLKAEYAAELIGAMTYGILKADDAVGLMMFSDNVKVFMRPKIGKEQFFRISKELKNENNYGGGKDYNRFLKVVDKALPRTTTIFIVSDFIGLPEDIHSSFNTFAHKFEMIAGFMIRDPNDNYMPLVGRVTISNPFTREELTVDTNAIAKRYNREVYEQKKMLENTFKKSNSDLIEFQSDQDFMKNLLMFLKVRKIKKQIKVK
ncbi:MAG: DUF58 domain-containing protein [Candidatus Woesearchaeota archaeon]